MPPRAFGILDWCVLGAYLLVVLAVGVMAARRSAGRSELFLAGRSMPMWAVAVSVLATALSAATFIGGPQQAYATDLTYFATNIGGLLAVIIVAVLFVPAYYRLGVTSVYELLGHEFGTPARTAASAMFMLGRVFASGARLFMVALPFALIAFGDIRPPALIASILIITACATLYTAAGGIRAVIWTDVLQAIVVIGTVAIAVGILWARIPLDIAGVVEVLRESGDKLTVIDLSFDLSKPFTLWASIIGFTLFNLAAFGTDQDLAQRLLTCRSAKSGAWSVVVANLIGWPVVMLFLVLGLLLFVYYKCPDVMGTAAPPYAIDDSRKVFLEFILAELPAGLRGLMVAGLFAAAMSSLDSALNAMASTTIADFYRPWRQRRGFGDSDEGSTRREVRVSRFAIVGWAIPLAGFATLCVFWQKASGQTLISFALGVMVFAYAGLLGVFATALLTRRGNTVSALAALAVGFIAVLLMQDFCWKHWAPWIGIPITLAFPWKMLVASVLSFGVCCTGARSASP